MYDCGPKRDSTPPALRGEPHAAEAAGLVGHASIVDEIRTEDGEVAVAGVIEPLTDSHARHGGGV